MVPEDSQFNPVCFLLEEKEKTSPEMLDDFLRSLR